MGVAKTTNTNMKKNKNKKNKKEKKEPVETSDRVDIDSLPVGRWMLPFLLSIYLVLGLLDVVAGTNFIKNVDLI